MTAPLFNKILIANRGEIAERVIRSCRLLGIQTVSVYSHADKNLPYVKLADEAIWIGGSNAADSYLDSAKILKACIQTGAQAIHPGYGFLSENPEFVDQTINQGLSFIGPTAATMRSMGDKISARKLMQKHGVPVVPGYDGQDQNPEKLLIEAQKIGFPVMVKATAGGGGRGLRVVEQVSEFMQAAESASSEAQNAFGNGRLFIEKFITAPRHIEVQIFGDTHGNITHIFERECSMQRRHQKVIEESPSPALDKATRQELYKTAIQVAKIVKYVGAGTIEFIYSDSDKKFYFLEMNTRLQVEHPVTEMVTGLDLVAEQIRVAAGQPLSFIKQPLQSRGHSIETRIYAEDPQNNFLPGAGKIIKISFPEAEGVRVDTGVISGSEISIYYDPMIAKLIVHAPDRNTAIDSLLAALKQTIIFGPKTNLDFLVELIDCDKFRSGNYTTHTISAEFSDYQGPVISPEQIQQALQVAGLLHYKAAHNYIKKNTVTINSELKSFEIW